VTKRQKEGVQFEGNTAQAFYFKFGSGAGFAESISFWSQTVVGLIKHNVQQENRHITPKWLKITSPLFL